MCSPAMQLRRLGARLLPPTLQGRCAAVLFFGHLLAVLPAAGADAPGFLDDGDSTAGDSPAGDAASLANSYVVDLSAQGIREVSSLLLCQSPTLTAHNQIWVCLCSPRVAARLPVQLAAEGANWALSRPGTTGAGSGVPAPLQRAHAAALVRGASASGVPQADSTIPPLAAVARPSVPVTARTGPARCTRQQRSGNTTPCGSCTTERTMQPFRLT